MASIMIVDDDDNIREYLEFLLSNTRFDTFMAPNGVDTIEAMQTIRPDLLLVDIKMPRMDGYELIRKIRESDAETPIIAISGVEDADAAAKVKAVGGNAFLAKPFSEAQLLGHINEWLRNIV